MARRSRTTSPQDTSETPRDTNARARAERALDLRSQGYDFDYIARMCGYTHRSAARKAWARAVEEIAQATVEQERANFKRSYGPVRVALHKRAREGDVRAAEVLVKLDERESKLFGYDVLPDTAAAAMLYTKRIILEEIQPLTPPSSPIAEHVAAESEAAE